MAKATNAQFMRGSRFQLRAWFLRHLQTLFSALGELTRSPLGTAMTAGVIGIALALPAGLYVLLDNVQAVGQNWDAKAEISLFLNERIDDRAAGRFATTLRQRPELRHVQLVTRAEALEEYRQLSGFAEALGTFEQENPLPALVLVEPTLRYSESEAIRGLVAELGGLPEVELAQFDLEWLQRLHAIIRTLKRGVVVLAALLALGVLLIVGNTIRLGIENRRAEIEIIQLVGATDAFIRRPFLYTGFCYGLLGAVMAWLLVEGGLWLVRGPLGTLASMYQADFLLASLSLPASLVLCMVGALLGLAGSWLAVHRHLHGVEAE